MAGIDPEAIRDALAAQVRNAIGELAQLEVKAYYDGTPLFPVAALFPASDYIDYWLTGTDTRKARVSFDLRSAFTYSAEDSLRAIDKLLASGGAHARSIIDAVHADKTLGGVVEAVFVQNPSVRSYGEENAGLHELSIRIDTWVTREVET